MDRASPSYLLSIAIPTYNNATWLLFSLKRILPQVKSLKGLVEVVVSDNCSTDGTKEQMQKVLAEYPTELRYYRNEENLGLNGNFQKVCERAQGEFIWMIGCDDILRIDAVEIVLGVLQANLALDYFYVNYSRFDPGENPKETIFDPFPQNDLGSPERQSHRVEKIRNLVPFDHNCFSPIYVSIMRRNRMLEAAELGMQGPLFSTLDTTVSFGAYVIEHLLDEPAYYIGEPLLAASTALSWSPFAPIYGTTMFPEIYRRLEAKGVPASDLLAHRNYTLALAADSLGYLLTNPKAPYRKQFSFAYYLKQHWHYRAFWQSMWKIFPSLFRYFTSKHYWAYRLGRI